MDSCLIRPEDIEEQIYGLCKTYAENPNSIILALSPANNDIANSDSLKFAKKIHVLVTLRKFKK